MVEKTWVKIYLQAELADRVEGELILLPGSSAAGIQLCTIIGIRT